MTTPDNPLLFNTSTELPVFADIKPGHILPALEEVLNDNRAEIEALSDQDKPSWASLMAPLEALEERLQRTWGPVGNLNAVCDSDELRPVYQKGIMLVSAYQSELAQNEVLYTAIKKLRDSESFKALSSEKKQVIEHALRDFRLSGAELNPDDKARFKAIQMRLAELGTSFEQHLLDATRAYRLHIEDEVELAGLPDSIKQAAAQRAAEESSQGWMFTLDAPSYIPFMQHAEGRDLRRQMYTAYVTRASEGALDNTSLINEILKLRSEAAALLSFDNYGAYSLATKTAKGSDEVTEFLRELAEKSHPVAEKEVAELEDFVCRELGLDTLEAWDIAFAAEKLRQKKFDFSQEDLKPYFPEGLVLNGMFETVKKLYGLSIKERKDINVWHKDVHYFDILNRDGEKIAGFYLDAYARPHKRGGAWMDECIIRWKKPNGSLQLPVAYLVCNFASPMGDTPALWTFDEVLTLFHEFGHGLHHMLTHMETLGVSGIRGVPWDAVELPSQFMENYCWEREVLDSFARHYQTDEVLPAELYEKMYAAKNFHAGMQMLRQVEFSLFDFLLHTEFDPAGDITVQEFLDEVRREVAVITPPAFNKFQNSFSHIFAGGYAAGYYSYKWAEVLSADAYATFEEAGIFDPETAESFHSNILSIGGSRDIMQAFEKFRGRRPTVDALLRHSGLNK